MMDNVILQTWCDVLYWVHMSLGDFDHDFDSDQIQAIAENAWSPVLKGDYDTGFFTDGYMLCVGPSRYWDIVAIVDARDYGRLG